MIQRPGGDIEGVAAAGVAGAVVHREDDSLLAQLDVWGYDDECLVWQIVDNHMKDAEKHNFAAIARNWFGSGPTPRVNRLATTMKNTRSNRSRA